MYEEFNQHNFVPVEYIDSKGEKRPEYVITRDGFSFLVMGFTGKKAARFKEEFINAFNVMEHRLRSLEKPQSRLDILVQSVLELKAQQEYLNVVKGIALETKEEVGIIKEKVSLLEAKTTTRPGYFTIAAYAKWNEIRINDRQSKSLGKMAASLCKKLSYPIDKVPDGRYGYVYSYPSSILQETFQKNGLHQTRL